MPGKKSKMEGEVYYPSDEVIAQSYLKDWEKTAEFARNDLEGFWGKEAAELEWFQKWDKVLDDSKKPFFKWFVGGKPTLPTMQSTGVFHLPEEHCLSPLTHLGPAIAGTRIEARCWLCDQQ